MILDCSAHKSRSCYARLTEAEQCLAFSFVGRLACPMAMMSIGNPPDGDGHNKPIEGCLLCDDHRAPRPKTLRCEGRRVDESFLLFESLLKVSQVHKSKRPSIAAMAALRHLVSHSEDDKSLDLTESAYGQWCLRALQNPARDMRIAAGSVHFRRSALSAV